MEKPGFSSLLYQTIPVFQFLICTVALTACSLKGMHTIFNIFIFNQCQMLRYNNEIKHTARIFQKKKSPHKYSLTKPFGSRPPPSRMIFTRRKEKGVSILSLRKCSQIRAAEGGNAGLKPRVKHLPFPLRSPSALNKALHTDVLPSRSTLTALFPFPCKYSSNISRRILPLYLAEKSDVTSH